MVSNLRGQAAAWFTTQQKNIVSISEVATALRKKFIPADLQKRLRDKLYALEQPEGGGDLAEYITRYRQLISQVTQMSELDHIKLFYRRCDTGAETVFVALEYELTHMAITSHDRTKKRQQREVSDGPELMEIGNTSFMDRSECMHRILCFHCKSSGHPMCDCRSGGGRTSSQQAPRRSYSYGNSQRYNVQKFQQGNIASPAQSGASADTTELLFDHLTVNAISMISGTRTESSPVRKKGTVSLHRSPVTFLLDSDADHNVMRCGLAGTVVRRKCVQIERFDDQTTEDVVNAVEADIGMEQYGFPSPSVHRV
ncbi:hypothetical protein PHMEG_00023766 [Phytophthora megakarya]|uniref:Retrotransposon gag domain-containing protein n=1 Tax=Phytophthora megakarya TaxID=4795 RepID=A0A225VHT8_9STRA|nr:hypothetical protein PHMEG_00023766 [Phytophthora megakarya]